MMGVKYYSWAKKPKTLLRNIKSGDIFCFSVNGKYRIGRIMTQNSLGHVAEIFDQVLDTPDASKLVSMKRLGRPVILDSYGLFDRKIEGDWRIVAHDEGYIPHDESVRFTSGIASGCKKIDIFDNEEAIAESEAKKLPDYSPMGEDDVIEELGL
ncbi:immunity 26/phosphotriesterase HocA family protein [Pseudomonas syringae pv. aptata]|uniref:Imm26 family immunity protein n=1 Tax=Pseudomonas syringae TaxID=317 RepID=UPI00203FE8E8|nr:Imm26 family immunity protein [Pseudomonas syringae]MCK0545919.1 immunity 26/phosphotriesterase HocA family protein [Pseudomonas syringae pv. aptata]